MQSAAAQPGGFHYVTLAFFNLFFFIASFVFASKHSLCVRWILNLNRRVVAVVDSVGQNVDVSEQERQYFHLHLLTNTHPSLHTLP
jgi:hypothetical protein